MILNDLPFWMAVCLLTTLVVELLAALALGVRGKKDILNIILINVLTNPIVVLTTTLISFSCGSGIGQYYEYAIELAVLAAEGLFYLKVLDYKKINPFLLSLILNAASYSFGFIIDFIYKGDMFR